MEKNKENQGQMYGVKLKNELEKELGPEEIMMKRDSANSPNYTLTFPVPENDLTGRSRVEKTIENFYSGQGFEMGTVEGGQIAKKDNEAYIIGIVRDTPHFPGEYNIRIAKTEKPELFYKNKE